jgi:periplasmic copper chaperone A
MPGRRDGAKAGPFGGSPWASLTGSMHRRWLMPATVLAWRLIASGTSMAQDVQAGRLVLTGAWAKAADADQRLSFAFVTIRNRGGEADCLMTASSAAAVVELREPDAATQGGARVVTEGFVIPAGGLLALEPGGAHLLLRDLQGPLALGDEIRVLLRFERAGTVAVAFRTHWH